MVKRKKHEGMRQSANRNDDRDEPDRHQAISGGEKEDWIGRQLREVYDKMLSEPIPDRLLDLLEQIDKKDSDAK